MELNEAKEMLLKEQEERVNRCKEKIAKILEEEKCQMETWMIVTPQGNIPQMKIVVTQ